MKEKYSINSILVGLLDVNCYFVFNSESKHLYIIDTGSDADRIIEESKKYDYNSVSILLTHAHVDHISATGEVSDKLNAELVYLHQEDEGLYFSKDNNILPYVPTAENLPKTNNNINCDDFEIIHTPGHSLGGVCFYFKEINTLFSGDTLFLETIGRTDLYGGSFPILKASIKNKLFILPDKTIVCPGHGNKTTIAYEKKYNKELV